MNNQPTLTQSEYDSLVQHREEMEKIVKNASASFLSAELRDIATSINQRLGYKDCNHCNSGLYRQITRVYSLFCKYSTIDNAQPKVNRKSPKCSRAT